MMHQTTPGHVLVRPPLAVELSDRIREMILEGALMPGKKVPEKELTIRFGVSRTPVREALKMLAAEGVIRLLPNRGAIVAELTLDELEEVFPVLAALEGAAGELAAERATDAEIAEIGKLNDRMRAAFAAGDRPSYFALNQQIHAALLAATRNQTLIQQHQTVAHRVRRARYQANLAPDRWEEAIAEHDGFVEALESRDRGRLGRLMKEHLEHKLGSLRAAFARASETGSGSGS